ncbi:MAG: hypothetical protein GY787_13005 [Alteromonadales bacterium]|nr:hypothetical protein [Alteromonadales bacterium]
MKKAYTLDEIFEILDDHFGSYIVAGNYVNIEEDGDIANSVAYGGNGSYAEQIGLSTIVLERSKQNFMEG